MIHLCEAVSFKNQGRCKHCGKFMPKQSITNNSILISKNKLLDLLREHIVEIFHVKFNNEMCNLVTLKSEYLSNYIGNRTSKKADEDTVFAYDVNLNRFVSIKVSTITDYGI